MATHNEPARALEFLLSEAAGTRSRENKTLAASQGDLIPGTVLAKINSGAHTAVGAATTAGNGDFVADSVSASAGAKAGVYTLISVTATKAELYDPDGNFMGLYTIGDAYAANGIAFDTEGTWAAGDSATITVTIAAGEQYVVYDNTATNGAQVAAAILAYKADNGASTQAITVIARDAEVKADYLDWDANDAAGIAAGKIDLASVGIIVRTA